MAESIVGAINEMFNERASANFIDCLVIDGFVGTCVQSEPRGTRVCTHTSYFIATQISGSDFIRVDYCGDSETTWNN